MNRRRKVFEKIVNVLLVKHLAPTSESAIAKNIPIKYLKYFKEVTSSGNGMKIRYRYRGPSTSDYRRDPSYIHMNNANRFAIYERQENTL